MWLYRTCHYCESLRGAKVWLTSPQWSMQGRAVQEQGSVSVSPGPSQALVCLFMDSQGFQY